jgi:hypothetical protein
VTEIALCLVCKCPCGYWDLSYRECLFTGTLQACIFSFAAESYIRHEANLSLP